MTMMMPKKVMMYDVGSTMGDYKEDGENVSAASPHVDMKSDRDSDEDINDDVAGVYCCS